MECDKKTKLLIKSLVLLNVITPVFLSSSYLVLAVSDFHISAYSVLRISKTFAWFRDHPIKDIVS